jgi:hypothetical protein
MLLYRMRSPLQLRRCWMIPRFKRSYAQLD